MNLLANITIHVVCDRDHNGNFRRGGSIQVRTEEKTTRDDVIQLLQLHGFLPDKVYPDLTRMSSSFNESPDGKTFEFFFTEAVPPPSPPPSATEKPRIPKGKAK